MEKCYGGNLTKISFGYWRINSQTDHIYLCYNNIKNCLNKIGDFTCLYGRIGALCEQCDYYGSIWKQNFVNYKY